MKKILEDVNAERTFQGSRKRSLSRFFPPFHGLFRFIELFQYLTYHPYDLSKNPGWEHQETKYLLLLLSPKKQRSPSYRYLQKEKSHIISKAIFPVDRGKMSCVMITIIEKKEEQQISIHLFSQVGNKRQLLKLK